MPKRQGARYRPPSIRPSGRHVPYGASLVHELHQLPRGARVATRRTRIRASPAPSHARADQDAHLSRAEWLDGDRDGRLSGDGSRSSSRGGPSELIGGGARSPDEDGADGVLDEEPATRADALGTLEDVERVGGEVRGCERGGPQRRIGRTEWRYGRAGGNGAQREYSETSKRRDHGKAPRDATRMRFIPVGRRRVPFGPGAILVASRRVRPRVITRRA